MSIPHYHPWLHRLAVATAVVALLPILMGALVTTKDAGMAFKDWPSSDGHNMIAYPWLSSMGDKFLEHGHRLGGLLIGVVSILLATTAAAYETRRWVKVLTLCVLVAVVAQGLLGGSRVRLDARGLAFVHGSFAALVMGLMVSVATITSRSWFENDTKEQNRKQLVRLRSLAVATTTVVFVQYMLGGLLRHHGRVLFEHLGFAFVAAMMVVWLAMSAAASGVSLLKAPAGVLAVLTMLQLALGAAAWVTRFGFGDRVAVYGSSEQVISRTGHVLCGMLLFATVVVLMVRAARAAWWCDRQTNLNRGANALSAGLPMAGGVP